MMKKLFFCLLISSSVWAQQKPQAVSKEFSKLVKVEDEEKFYDNLVAKNPANINLYDEYRAQLAIEWLAKENVEKYKFYKNTNPKFNPLQLFELSNLLEYWVDDDKNLVLVEQISGEVLTEIEKLKLADPFARTGILLEINAVANGKLGNMAKAMANIEKSGANPIFRNFPYFRNTKANYLNRYATILSLDGQNQRALDTLVKAVSEANSTPKTISTLKKVYKKVHGSINGLDNYVASLQDKAYHKIYADVEKAWILETKTTPAADLKNVNGKVVNLSDLKGKIVIVDFWSTTCKPCVAAFPAFERLAEFYKKVPSQLFIVNTGESTEEVKSYLEKGGYKLDVLFDQNASLYKGLGAIGTPHKFVIDANGNINQSSVGYSGSDDKEFYKLKAMVELTKARNQAVITQN